MNGESCEMPVGVSARFGHMSALGRKATSRRRGSWSKRHERVLSKGLQNDVHFVSILFLELGNLLLLFRDLSSECFLKSGNGSHRRRHCRLMEISENATVVERWVWPFEWNAFLVRCCSTYLAQETRDSTRRGQHGCRSMNQDYTGLWREGVIRDDNESRMTMEWKIFWWPLASVRTRSSSLFARKSRQQTPHQRVACKTEDEHLNFKNPKPFAPSASASCSSHSRQNWITIMTRWKYNFGLR